MVLNGASLARAVLDLIFHTLRVTLRVLFSLVYGGSVEKVPPIDNLILLDSATALANKIRNRKLSSVQVVESFIRRIDETNGFLNAVVDNRFQSALQEAEKADNFIKSSGKTSDEIASEYPFLGVPFTAKEAIGVKGLSNTAGLFCRKGVKADSDADVVALLRKAGAIPIAATNLPEVCLWWECFNTVYGRTRNPYNTNRTSGGSSGGEGAINSAAGSPMGLGSDLAGSVRMPAHFNGIFGHKTSTGIVSLKGHYPLPKHDFLQTYVSIGPMSRFATDLLPILKTITIPSQRHLLRLNEKVDVTKLKFYYAEDDGGGILLSPVEPEIKELVRNVVAYLKKSHGIVAERLDMPTLKQALAIWFAKMAAPGERQLPAELANNKGKVNPVRELLKFVFGLSNHTLPVLVVTLLEQFGVTHGGPAHQHLTSKCDNFKADFEALLGTNGVFIYPTHPTAAQYHNEALSTPLNFAYGGLFNVTGLPSTHCPMGLNKNGMPIGVQVVAAQNQDRLTIAVAEELERAFGGWVPPSVSV